MIMESNHKRHGSQKMTNHRYYLIQIARLQYRAEAALTKGRNTEMYSNFVKSRRTGDFLLHLLIKW